MGNIETIQEKIKELEENIVDLKKRWPAHSLKPEMFAQLETLEEQLEFFKSLLEENNR